MGRERRWAIGIDPGLTETGVGLFRETSTSDLEHIESATYTCSPQGVPDICRIVSMANSVVNLITEWLDHYGIESVDVAIEHPVYKRNAKAFKLQVQLYEEIMSGLFHQHAGLLDELWVTEVNPQTSKSLAGCGPREKPVEQSPFAKFDVPKATKEALADAWAHALGTWGVAKKADRTGFHLLQTAVVKERFRS